MNPSNPDDGESSSSGGAISSSPNSSHKNHKKVPAGGGILRPSSYSNLESLQPNHHHGGSPTAASSPRILTSRKNLTVGAESGNGSLSNFRSGSNGSLSPGSLSNPNKRMMFERRTSSSTILNHQVLGKYSTERFYTLSEMQTHAPNVVFLQTMIENGEDDDDDHHRRHDDLVNQSTHPMVDILEEPTTTTTTNNDDPLVPSLPLQRLDSSASSKFKSKFTQYSILYVLWRPEMTSDVEVFVDTVLRGCIAAMQRHATIVPSQDYLMPGLTALDRRTSSSSLNDWNQNNDKNDNSNHNLNNGDHSSSENTDLDLLDGGKENQETPPTNNHTVCSAGGYSATTTTSPIRSSSSRSNGLEEETTTNKPTTSLYIVVERVFPSSRRMRKGTEDEAIVEKNDNGDGTATSLPTLTSEEIHQSQEALAQQLVRHAALQLRHVCEGISVYCSNHERAAPGLEACMNAVAVGAADRRKYAASAASSSNATTKTTTATMLATPFMDEDFRATFGDGDGKDSKDHNKSVSEQSHDSHSYMGFVTLTTDDFLGLQEAAGHHTTDAAQGVLQSCWCAEWNGRGNLASFAKRAHAQWRLDRGLPSLPLLVGQRKPPVPRRSNRKNGHNRHGGGGGKDSNSSYSWFDEQALDQAIQSFLYDFGILVLAVLYVAFHYGQELYDLCTEWFEWLERLFRRRR